MIERVIIKNYKGIKSADIKFHDFTNIMWVIMGLENLQLLRQCL